ASCARPAGRAGEIQGVIDLVEMKCILRDKSDKANIKYSLVDIPGPYKAQAEEYHHHLLEAASHVSDEIVELILEGQPVPKDLLRAALRKGTLEGKLA